MCAHAGRERHGEDCVYICRKRKAGKRERAARTLAVLEEGEEAVEEGQVPLEVLSISCVVFVCGWLCVVRR